MATAIDLINSTVPGLRNYFEDAFSTYNPFVKALLNKFVKEPTTGPYIEFNILTGGPGRVTDLYGGSELLNASRENITEKGNEYPHRWVYSFGITGKDIDEINDAKDNVVKKGKIGDLLQAYHMSGITDVASGFADQFFCGKFSTGTNDRSNGSKGMVSLNGNSGVGYYSQSSTTARTGILEFAAPGSQTGTVHNIASRGASGGVEGWYNQYSEVTGSANRRTVLRSVKAEADRQGADRNASVDFMFSDPASREAYVAELVEHTMYATVESGKDPVTVKAREGLIFGGDKRCLWFDDDHIDVSDSTCFPTTAAQEGVTYMLSSEDWRLFSTTREKMFTWREMQSIPVQDAFIQAMLFHFNMYCISRRTQAVVVGTAR